MTNKLSKAWKLKSEGIHSGKKADKALVQKAALTMKSEIVRDGQAYFQYLIVEVLRQAGLSTIIVKGLAAFHPFIMFKRPTEVAFRHFDVLYSTFLLRSWVTAVKESTCHDEYVGLIDYLRVNYTPDFDVTQHFRELIDFLMSLEYMQSHTHLMHLFSLSYAVSVPHPVVPITPLLVWGLLAHHASRAGPLTLFFLLRATCLEYQNLLPIVSLIVVSTIFLCCLVPLDGQLT